VPIIGAKKSEEKHFLGNINLVVFVFACGRVEGEE
jgi:hypothetical protein